MSKTWYCDKCQTDKVVYTQKGVQCASCRGKVYLAEKREYSPTTPNLLFNPKTKTIRIKDYSVICPNCEEKITVNIDFSIAKLPGFFKKEED